MFTSETCIVSFVSFTEVFKQVIRQLKNPMYHQTYQFLLRFLAASRFFGARPPISATLSEREPKNQASLTGFCMTILRVQHLLLASFYWRFAKVLGQPRCLARGFLTVCGIGRIKGLRLCGFACCKAATEKAFFVFCTKKK